MAKAPAKKAKPAGKRPTALKATAKPRASPAARKAAATPNSLAAKPKNKKVIAKPKTTAAKKAIAKPANAKKAVSKPAAAAPAAAAVAKKVAASPAKPLSAKAKDAAQEAADKEHAGALQRAHPLNTIFMPAPGLLMLWADFCKCGWSALRDGGARSPGGAADALMAHSVACTKRAITPAALQKRHGVPFWNRK